MVKKILGKVLGTTEADAAYCIDCNGYYQYRCYGINNWQRRYVSVYGCYCQYKSYGGWVTVSRMCPV